MKSIFSICNDEIYKLNEPAPKHCDIIIPDNQAVTYKTSTDRNKVNISLDFGIIHEDNMTNKEKYEKAIEILNAKKESGDVIIKNLSPIYEVGIDYVLFDNTKGRAIIPIDEGIMIRHIPSPTNSIMNQNRFRILGVDESNEMHHRFVKFFNPKFSFKYRESLPCGIMGSKSKNFTFAIKNIFIHQLISDVQTAEQELFHHRPYECEHPCSEGVTISRESFISKYHSQKDIVIFDMVSEGISINPIHINDTFRHLDVDMRLIMNDYFIAYDENTILDFTK